MLSFWVSIEVHLAKPLSLMSDEGDRERAQRAGLVQALGVSAVDQAAMKDIVRARVALYELGGEQSMEIVFGEIEEIDPSEVEEDPELMEKLCGPLGERGVWFQTA